MDILKDLILLNTAIFIALAVILMMYFQQKFSYWKKRSVKTPSCKFPFGNIFQILSKNVTFGEYFKNTYTEFKYQGLRYFGIYFFDRPKLVLTDLNLIKNIFTKDFYHFMDHGSYANEKNDPLSRNLFNLNGAKWKNLRMKLTPAFTSSKMKMMFQTIVDGSEGLIDIIEDSIQSENVLDIRDIVGRFTTDIIGSCAFGIECNSLRDPNSNFRNYVLKMFEVNTKQRLTRFLAITWPTIVNFFKLSVISRDITDFFMNVIQETVKYREKNSITRKDFMHLLIQLKNNKDIEDADHSGGTDCINDRLNTSNNQLTMDELAAQAYVFFLAGFESSSSTISFCLYELMIDSNIRTKLRQEINTILCKYNGDITYEAIMEMTFMDKCIRETLRKYPPIPVLFRECTETYRVPDSDLIIEKGVQVFIPIMGIQHDEEYFPNPNKFDPERFNQENITKRSHFAWLPFGEGPRICIGLRFGLLQIKVFLTVLLRNYEYSLNPKTIVPITFSTNTPILTMKGGLWLDAAKIVNN